MKPIFAIDITLNKKNEEVNGSEFITKTASKQKSEELESNQEELEQSINKSQLPLWIRIVKYICGLFALIVAGSWIKASPDIGFAQAFKNAPALIILGIVCGIAWIILHIISKAKEKKVLKAENVEQQVEDIDTDIQDIYKELGVPSDAISVDVLMFKYKIKNEEICPQAIGLQAAPFINFEIKAYTDGKYLYFADVENVYSFDLSELKLIKTINKRISVLNWNKDEDPRKGEYKQYKITMNDMGSIFFKPYYILEGERDGQAYCVYFPCYELPTLERLTGLRAKSNDELL